MSEEKKEESPESPPPEKAISLYEMIDMLDAMGKSIERLPPGAAMAPITHADHYHLLLVLTQLFKKLAGMHSYE